MGVASGYVNGYGADALAGGPLEGKEKSPMLVTKDVNNPGASVLAYLKNHASTLKTGHIYGGTAAVSTAAQTAMENAAGKTARGRWPISLNTTTAPQGGSFTGKVENPGTVDSVSLTGCGFNNENVAVGSDGSFSKTLPVGQSTGSCTLTFNILYKDGTTKSQAIPFNVTAVGTSTTAAPDLVSATVDTSTGVVTYTFDENVTGNVAAPGDFYVYNAAGQEAIATQAQINGTTVIAQFTTAQASAATLAAVADAAVSDSAGTQSYASSAPLSVQTQAAATTDGPDLQSVSNLRTEGGSIVADFRFDEAVSRTLTDAAAAAGDFELVANDGTSYPSQLVPAYSYSVDNRTVTVAFSGTTTVPIGNIVRGVANNGAVQDSGTNQNVTQTEPRTAPPAFTTGVTADRTNDPDLVSVAVAGTNTVAYTFDEPVQGAGFLDLSKFYVYDSASNTDIVATGGSATRSPSDTSVVNVTYPSSADVANAVGTGVNDGAVLAVDDSAPNSVHELPLQSVVNSAGRTAIADLVSVKISSNAFGLNTVVYTFDSAPSNANTFGLVDANGTLFSPSGAGVVSGNTVTFTEGVNGYTDAQAAAAVVGNAEDTTGTGTTSTITTGDVNVTR